MWRLKLFLVAIFTSIMVLPVLLQAQNTVTLDLERIQRATVYVIQAYSDTLTIACVGSGTIVRYDGLILTNAHNTVKSNRCGGDVLIIAMSLNIGEPPVPRYRAEIVQSDAGLDLALLRITRQLDGRLIDPARLPVLPFVELANSSDVALDETITLAGYPDTGNAPVLLAPGSILGFIDEPGGDDRAWFKITASVPLPGVISGGGAYNQRGQLVGVPTAALLNFESGGECRLLEDVNADGFINRNDVCVPIGDFISVLRPSNYARPLLRSASLSLNIDTLTSPGFQVAPVGEPAFSRLFFAPTVIDGLPSTVIGSAPLGTDSLFLFFDYVNMTPETVYELRVTVDGVPVQTFDLPPVRWSGGERGLWYIGAAGVSYPNGVYEFRLYINGIAAASHSIVVGGATQTIPSLSNPAFGILDERGNLQGNGYVLPAGPIATARFIYQNMQPGIPWTVIWSYNGLQIARTDDVWREADGANGAYPVSLRPPEGLVPGTYRVDLYLNALLTATGDFVVAGTQAAALPQVFTNIEFIRADDPLELPNTTPANTFPDGANTLYARFDWERMTPGTPWTMRWRVDNEIFYEETRPWSSPENGVDFTTRLTAPGGLPDGTYTLELLINGILLETEQVSIGIGQLAINRLAQAGGVQLQGRIIDAETGKGLEGISFILISEEFSVREFVWNQDQIYALAITDRDGNFEIDRALQIGAPYSALIAAQGYLPVAADGLEIAEDAASPIELIIPLTRDG
jgi:hypothetical protein